MKREEQNIAIAKALGFTPFDPGRDSGSPIQWIYPDKYDGLQYSTPTTTLPDFVHLIDTMVLLIEKNPTVRHDYNTRLEFEEA